MKRLFKNFNQKEVQDPQGQLEVSCKNAIFIVPSRSKDVLEDDRDMSR